MASQTIVPYWNVRCISRDGIRQLLIAYTLEVLHIGTMTGFRICISGFKIPGIPQPRSYHELSVSAERSVLENAIRDMGTVYNTVWLVYRRNAHPVTTFTSNMHKVLLPVVNWHQAHV